MDQPINRGITLIELVIYMGLFSILVGGVLNSTFYLQNILQYNALEYKTQENIYRQLNLLQQHINSSTKVEVSSSSFKIYNPQGYTEQYLKENLLHMRYVYPSRSTVDIILYPYIKFQSFSFTQETGHESLSGNSTLWVDIERIDSKGKVKTLREWVVD